MMHKSRYRDDIMIYDVGDRVKIVPQRVGSAWNSRGEMDKYLGTTMTVRWSSGDSGSSSTYRMEEDRHDHDGVGWYWYQHMIAGLAEDFTVDVDVEFDVILSGGVTNAQKL